MNLNWKQRPLTSKLLLGIGVFSILLNLLILVLVVLQAGGLGSTDLLRALGQTPIGIGFVVLGYYLPDIIAYMKGKRGEDNDAH